MVPLLPIRGGAVPNESGYEYDVFVSYAHADNEKPIGSAAEYGWVTTLAHNLNTGQATTARTSSSTTNSGRVTCRKQHPSVATALIELYRFAMVWG
jgi:hypothetical protein